MLYTPRGRVVASAAASLACWTMDIAHRPSAEQIEELSAYVPGGYPEVNKRV